MKQRHYAWVCVGTNEGSLEATWFYAFRTCEKAYAFTAKAFEMDASVEWLVYPCEFMSVEETLENMDYCLKNPAGEYEF